VQPSPVEAEEPVDGDNQGPVRCAVHQKYPFGAAANQSEDNIIVDKKQIKAFIYEFNAKNEQKEAEATKQNEPKKPKKGGKPQKESKPAVHKEKLMTMKMLIQKMVPYTSAVYAEHVFRAIGFDSNTKVSLDTIDTYMDTLVTAAHKLRDLVKEMD